MATNTQAILLPIDGEFPVDPEIRVQPTVQRAAPVANVGWKFRHRLQVTNSSDEPWANHPYALNIGITTDEVTAGAMLASGNDVRVWHQGREIARTLNSHNVAATQTLVWIVIPYLGAGASTVFDIVYGNTAAGAPPTLTAGTDLPAFDIVGTGATRSTNTFWRYLVDRTVANAGLGGWYLSSGTAQPDVRHSVPGAWQPVNTLQSDDDRKQESYSTYVATGTKYQGRFEARRAAPGALLVGQDNGMDGVAIRLPIGITSVRADIRWTNLAIGDTDVTPIGQVVIVTRNQPSEAWKTLYSNTALQATEATIATATYTPAATVKEVAFAVWPQSGNNIDLGAKPDRYINAGWFTTLELVPANNSTQTFLETAQEVYELATELRFGGGGDTVGIPPYKSIFLGNAKQASGVGTPRLACKLNEQVVVKTDERKVEIWNSALTAKVEDAPIPAYRAVDGVLDDSGATVEQASAEWMPLVPMVNPLTNPSADSVATGWTQMATDVLMVADPRVRDTVVFDSTPASFKVVVTANTGGTGDRVGNTPDDYLPIGNRENVSYGAALRTTNVNLRPRLGVIFYNEALAQIGVTSFMPSYTVLAANAWYRRLAAVAVAKGAVYWKPNIEAESVTANQIGTIWFDTVEINDTEIALIDVATGTIVLSAEWTPRYAYA